MIRNKFLRFGASLDTLEFHSLLGIPTPKSIEYLRDSAVTVTSVGAIKRMGDNKILLKWDNYPNYSSNLYKVYLLSLLPFIYGTFDIGYSGYENWADISGVPNLAMSATEYVLTLYNIKILNKVSTIL